MRQFALASVAAAVMLIQGTAAAPRHHANHEMLQNSTSAETSPSATEDSSTDGVVTVMVTPIQGTPSAMSTDQMEPMDSSELVSTSMTAAPTVTPAMGASSELSSEKSAGSDATSTESSEAAASTESVAEMSSQASDETAATPAVTPDVTPVSPPTTMQTMMSLESVGSEPMASPSPSPATDAWEPSSPAGSPSPSDSTSSSSPDSSANPNCGTAYSLFNNNLRLIRHPRNLPAAAEVKRSTFAGEQAQACQPGTYQCLPNGWQVCDASGNYQFGGNCPSNTHCQFYPSTGGLLCLPSNC